MNVEKTIPVERANLIFGTDKVLKLLKEGKLKAAVYSANTPADVIERLNATKGSTEVQEYEGSSTKLGTLCGRPHTISVLGIKK